MNQNVPFAYHLGRHLSELLKRSKELALEMLLGDIFNLANKTAN